MKFFLYFYAEFFVFLCEEEDCGKWSVGMTEGTFQQCNELWNASQQIVGVNLDQLPNWSEGEVGE